MNFKNRPVTNGCHLRKSLTSGRLVAYTIYYYPGNHIFCCRCNKVLIINNLLLHVGRPQDNRHGAAESMKARQMIFDWRTREVCI